MPQVDAQEESYVAIFDDFEATPAPVEKAQERTPIAASEPQVVKEAPKEDAPKVEAVATPPSESDTETKARAIGWVPLSEWKRNPANWVPAEQYLQNKPFANQIKSYQESNNRLQRTLKEREDQIKALTDQYRLVHEAAYTKALKDLNAAKKQAVADGDTDRVERIDQAIDTTRAEQARSVAPEFRPTFVPDAVLQHWADSNQDILKDPEAAPFAASYDQRLMASFPQMDLAERLEKVTQATKRAFPEKFNINELSQNVNQPVATPSPRQAPALVESVAASSAGSARSKPLFTVDSLTPEEHSMMVSLEKSGIKREDYLKDIQFVRENPNTPVYFE